LNAAKLVLRLVLLDAVEHKASLGIVEETEEIPTLLEGDNIHKTGGVVMISANLSVNLDTTLHADLLAFLSGQSVLETLSEDDGNRETLTLLMGSLAGLWGPHTTHFAEIPVAGRIEALEMFLRSARHFNFLLSTMGSVQSVVLTTTVSEVSDGGTNEL
jgi:hypothetical protein